MQRTAEDRTIPCPSGLWSAANNFNPVRCPYCKDYVAVGSTKIVRYDGRIWHRGCFNNRFHITTTK